MLFLLHLKKTGINSGRKAHRMEILSNKILSMWLFFVLL